MFGPEHLGYPIGLLSTDILLLPGNRTAFDSLAVQLHKGRAIAFVGAGASAGLYPLWNEVIQSLADLAVRRRKVSPDVVSYWLKDPSLTPQQRVDSIARNIGEVEYREFLRKTFSVRTGTDGKRYTRIHELLMLLPFRAYVTTNYDPALDFVRAEVRPASRSTGTPTWQDETTVLEWLTGEIFEQPNACPILWAHGYWQLPETIVLNAGEYSRTYSRSVYRSTFKRLWQQDRLVFIGFGFGDPRFTFMAGEIVDELQHVLNTPRHIALIGIEPNTTAAVINERRTRMTLDYGVDPIFYRVHPTASGGQDHFELIGLLERLRTAVGTTGPRQVPPPVSLRERLQQLWVHETTNDDMFIGRDPEQSRLDRWVRDPAVRVIGISAVGGTGKTALVGHWLKNTDGWLSRKFEGVFAWSFYRDRDSAEFAKALVNWATTALGVRDIEKGAAMRGVLHVVRSRQIVILLDGLELVQEGPDDARYGSFLDALLRDFLTGVCNSSHGSVIVLTSRFPFADLERFLGRSFHQLELTGLSEDNGAQHLASMDVLASDAERAWVSEYLGGHPLALRVFAEALPDEQKETPRDFLASTFSAANITRESALVAKLNHLLSFYERRLPAQQTRVLAVVALFHAPVTESIIVTLVRSTMIEEGLHPLPAASALGSDLQRLVSRGILMQEPSAVGRGFLAHPILRDHFRAAFVRKGARASLLAANLLSEQPGRDLDTRGAELMIAAMDVLVGSGHVREANDLYHDRLDDGRVFMKLAAPLSALRAALVFVRDDKRRDACRKALPAWRLSYFLNEVGFHAWMTGQYDLAMRFYEESNAIDRGPASVTDQRFTRSTPRMTAMLAAGLRNEAHVLVCIGRLKEALERTELTLADGGGYSNSMRYNENGISHAYVLTGWIRTLSGTVHDAATDFMRARIHGPTRREMVEAIGIDRGVRWCELLARCGLAEQARLTVMRYLPHAWSFEITARYQWVLALCALSLGKVTEADSHLRVAEETCRGAQLLFDLARVHVASAASALKQRDTAAAEQRINDALALAQPRNMRLVHADALALRGRIRLAIAKDHEHLGGALDDAEEALRIASECGYAWAERDAVALHADVCKRLAVQDERFERRAVGSRERLAQIETLLRLNEQDLENARLRAERDR